MVQIWRTVRVFVSSTFRDMQAERDYLVKVVFPELRERCSKRQLHLVDLDLRWGVTEEEAEQGKALEVILDEIDRSRPFFIAFLGERYGSVPESIPEDTQRAYPWLEDYHGYSLTALEMIHGVLRNPELARRSFFYFRDPKVVAQVPESRRADFVAENPEATSKLWALKEEIRATGRPIMENYSCCWDDDKGHLVDLDVFGHRILEDLWTAICAEYPEETLELDLLSIDRQMHDAFAEERSYLHVGRLEEVARLNQYVQGTDRRPVVITGESGCGKSAFLANWHRQYAAEHPDDFVLAYFIGASPDSTNHLHLLRNMCQELKRKFALKQEIPPDDKKLSETLAMLLVAASRDKLRIVIVVDALDQLLPLEAAHGLGWLLDYMPEKVRLVVSSLEGDCLEVLRRCGAVEIVLPPLSVDERRQIVHAMLSEWGRNLDDHQMTALLAHPGVKNPLYLRVSLEELKLFGRFELLTARIEALAKDIPGLFDQVLARLEEDHGRKLVTETFALLGCSRYGLTEAEMLDLLRREGEEQLPRASWARLVRSAKSYLVQRGEFLGFFHRQLADAVATRYLRHDKKHAKLAVYFEHAPLERKLDEYPYQLQHAEEWQALAAVLSDLDLFNYAWNHNREYEWTGYWQSLEGRFEPGRCYQAVTEAKIKSDGETQGVALLLDRIGSLLDEMALYPSALPFKQRSLSILEHAFGLNHPEVGASLDNLANLYRKQGKFVDALPLLRRSLAIYEHVFGPNHPNVAISLNNLALFYSDQGRYADALPLLRRALEIHERASGSDHREVATVLNNVALLYKNQSRFVEALSLYQRAQAIHESVFGPNHPNVATILNNIAALYCELGKFVDALPLLRRSLAIYEHVFGPNHPDVGTSLNNLAGLFYKQGKFAEALPLLRRALAICESVFGPNHPNVATILVNLADLYRDQYEYVEALSLYQRAQAIHEGAFGLDDPVVALDLSRLAYIYCKQGRFVEALPLLKRAVKINEVVFGSYHPNTKVSRRNLDVCQNAIR